MKKISGVIMDWAGTAVDYGCFAPLNAFLKVFSKLVYISSTSLLFQSLLYKARNFSFTSGILKIALI